MIYIRPYNIRGNSDAAVWVWPLFAVLLWTSGGELPWWVGWLTDEFSGKFAGGDATGAVQNAKETDICSQYHLKISNVRKTEVITYKPWSRITLWNWLQCVASVVDITSGNSWRQTSICSWLTHWRMFRQTEYYRGCSKCITRKYIWLNTSSKLKMKRKFQK